MAADARLPLNFRRRDGVVHAFNFNGTEVLPTDGWLLLKARCGRKAKHNPSEGPQWDRVTNDRITCIECLASLE